MHAYGIINIFSKICNSQTIRMMYTIRGTDKNLQRYLASKAPKITNMGCDVTQGRSRNAAYKNNTEVKSCAKRKVGQINYVEGIFVCI